MTIEKIIQPIVFETYGESAMSRAFITDLASKIETFSPYQSRYSSREGMIFQICWNWFSGGTTAENIAKRIETALLDSGI